MLLAVPWQFSLYWRSPQKCSAVRQQWRRALWHVFVAVPLPADTRRSPRRGPLSPPFVIATLNPHCLSHMPMARRVCRSSSTTKMRRMTHLPRGADAQCALSAIPAKKDGLPHDRAGSFALRISALPHFCRKSTVCLPSTVYKSGSTTPRHRIANFCHVRARAAPRRAIVDPKRFDLPRSMQAALCSLDHCVLSCSHHPARISRQADAEQCDRRSLRRRCGLSGRRRAKPRIAKTSGTT